MTDQELINEYMKTVEPEYALLQGISYFADKLKIADYPEDQNLIGIIKLLAECFPEHEEKIMELIK